MVENKENNIYHIWVKEAGYEEYDGFVVIAKIYENAINLIENYIGSEDYWSNVEYSKEKDIIQRIKYKIYWERIGETPLKKEKVILGSFIRA